MADKFCDLILELDPDIIMGHNIMKFDFPYWKHVYLERIMCLNKCQDIRIMKQNGKNVMGKFSL